MKPVRLPPEILVVDDDMTTSIMLQGILHRAGFRAVAVFDAAEAFARIQESTPDLVLLDVNLPDANGVEVCRQLRQTPGGARTPVLFISSNSDVSMKVRGFEAGAVDYISKPLAGEEVIARVSTHLRLKQAYESLAELQAEHIKRLTQAQEIIMPRPSDMPAANFHATMKQVLQAGGDFYDVIPVGESVTDYVVADASGHDLAAAFWTAALKALLSEYANSIHTPIEVMEAINNAMRRILPPGVFFSILLVRLNRNSGRVVFANAGHPPALLLRKTDPAATFIDMDSDVLGAFDDAHFDAVELQVKKGDRFFLYSDGLVDLSGNQQAGKNQLMESINQEHASTLEQQVANTFDRMTAAAAAKDDMLLMGVEI